MKNRPTRSTFLSRLQYFTDSIRQNITKGSLAPGDFLPSEMELSKKYKLSKLSVRKGLEQLLEEGFIEKLPRVGTRVAASQAQEKQVVKFVCHQSLIQEAAMESLIGIFEEQNPDIQIQFLPFPYQQYVENIDHYVNNDLIDVISINYDQFLEFKESDRLGMLEPQHEDASLYPFLQEGFADDSRLYAKPFIFSPVILCYNKEHIRENDVSDPDGSWSWEMLMDASRKLSDNGERYGFYFHLLSQNRWPIFLMQNGYQDSLSHQPNQAELFLESMTLCKDVILGQRVNKLMIADDDRYAENLFMKEKASIIMTTYFNLNYLLQSGIPFEVAPLPSMKDPRTLLLTIGLSVMKTSTRKEAAQRFVDFLTQYESQLYIREHSLSIPSHKAAAEVEVKEGRYQPERFLMYRDIIPSFRFYSELGMTSRQFMSLRNELSYFWSDLSDGDQLLAALKEITK